MDGNIEMFRLVAEAHAYYYLGSEWAKRRIKEYFNPFGKFNWMFNSLHRLMKQGIKGGLNMLYSNGMIRSIISDELKQMKFEDKAFDLKIKENSLNVKKKQLFQHEIPKPEII